MAHPIIIKKNQINKLQKNCGIRGDHDDNDSMPESPHSQESGESEDDNVNETINHT